MLIRNMTHPEYLLMLSDWRKFRLTMTGGRTFIEAYLKQFSSREDSVDFAIRKEITYCPAFAKAALNDIKNSIFQRAGEVTRIGGSKTYQNAVAGLEGGVDRAGSNMNAFIGTKILPELLALGRVGVYVDMPETIPGGTLLDTTDKWPYTYIYRAEEILNWARNKTGQVTAVLLKDTNYDFMEEFALPGEKTSRYRLLVKTDLGITVRFFDTEGNELFQDATVLDIPEIPMEILELPTSLLQDVADYQIAMLNLASSDMNYACRANFPFYIEQYDPRYYNPLIRQQGEDISSETEGGNNAGKDIESGVASGRMYPSGMNAPDFIHPSSEPLKASMEKQAQLKREIREIIGLNLANLAQTMASADSKAKDNEGLEAGLSFIGLILQFGENRIAQFWQNYENTDKVATVVYPKRYSLKTDKELREEANDLKDMAESVPSTTYKKEVCKAVVTMTLGDKVSRENLDKMHKEIDESPVIITDPKTLSQDILDGLVSPETASLVRGYPPEEAEKAAKAHAEKLARIAEAQAPGVGAVAGAAARGLPQADPNPNSGVDEKNAAKTKNDPAIIEDNTRGEGK